MVQRSATEQAACLRAIQRFKIGKEQQAQLRVQRTSKPEPSPIVAWSTSR
jgi:hypothetical protein